MRSPIAPLLVLSLSLPLFPACAGDDDPPPPFERERRDPRPHADGEGANGSRSPAPERTSASDATPGNSDSLTPPGTHGAAAPSGSAPPASGAPPSGEGDPPEGDGPTDNPGGGLPDPSSGPAPPNPGVDCGGGFGPDFFDIAPDCIFLAHSQSRLFEVDPWRGSVVDIGPTTGVMFDIDTAPDGTVYGVAARALHRYDATTGSWSRVGNLNPAGVNPNGLCINGSGVGFVTSGNQLYEVDLNTGRTVAAPNRMGTGFQSSGDCVIDKADIIYMSSSNTSGNDDLVRIDVDGTATLIGRTNHDQIYGLTAAWGRLFGTTGRGEIIDIDWNTGASRLLHSVPGTVFYGAASTASIDR